MLPLNSLLKQHQTRFLASSISTIAVVFFLFLLIIRFGAAPSATALDPSWTEVLSWIHLNDIQLGKDIVFTYGPLGFLHPNSSYIHGAFLDFIVGQIVLNAAVSVVIGLTLRWLPMSQAILFVALFVLWSIWISADVCWIIALVCCVVLLSNAALTSNRFNYWHLFFLVPLIATIALVKFSLFLLSIPATLCIAGIYWFRHRRLLALFAIVIYVLSLIAIWCANGQQLTEFSEFFLTSWEVASGYGHAMGQSIELKIEMGGMFIFVAIASMLFSILWQQRNLILSWILIGFLLASLFFAWRAFYTRPDHAVWFFAFTALFPFAISANMLLSLGVYWRMALSVVAVLATCVAYGVLAPHVFVDIPKKVGTQIADAMSSLLHLDQLYQTREAEWNALRQNVDLPRVRERIGNARVDILMYEQGMVLLNGFNYAPRPIFQSYSAYTPKLARLNETYFLSDQAPEFVLFKLQPIDGRLPMGEDPLVLTALLRSYKLVLIESGYILFERVVPDIKPIAEPSEEHYRDANLNTDIALPSSLSAPLLAFIDLELTPLGKLFSFLVREPPLRIVLDTENSQRLEYRFLRVLGSVGFVVSPVVRNTEEWVKLSLQKALPKVHSVRVESLYPWAMPLFANQFKIAFAPLPDAFPHSVLPEEEWLNVFFPGFSNTPIASTGLTAVITEQGQRALFMHAPAALEFKLQEGSYRITGEFGIQEAAITDTGCLQAQPDGIGVSVMHRQMQRDAMVWHSDIDPFRRIEDRGVHRFVIESLQLNTGDTVILKIEPGHNGGSTACDWGYVRNIQLQRSHHDSL